MTVFSFFRRQFKKKKSTYFISDNESLEILDSKLSQCKIFSVDTEFDWRTTYFPKLSIIQISTSKYLFLIDCLKINPQIILKKYLEDKKIMKVFHSVRSDATVLSKCINCITKNVFDIQVAEKILTRGEIKAYGTIVKKYYNLDLKQAETNSNWLKRPLTENQINYALEDVDYLIDIYFFQRKKLIKKNLLNEVFTFSKKELDLGNESLKKLRLQKVKKKYSSRNIDIFMWREEIAESQNIPPTYIFKDKYLRELSKIKDKDNLAKKRIMTIIGDSQLTNEFIVKFL
tara:strand:- start:1754 stop:2614 length:861 start_codon:yes stop_codon:yes gene_type:complete